MFLFKIVGYAPVTIKKYTVRFDYYLSIIEQKKTLFINFSQRSIQIFSKILEKRTINDFIP